MLDNDPQPVSLTGLLILAAITIIFLVIVWLIGSAFVRPENEPRAHGWNKYDHASVVTG